MTIDDLIDIAKNSNLYTFIGYEVHKDLISLLEDVKRTTLKDPDFAQKAKDEIHHYTSWLTGYTKLLEPKKWGIKYYFGLDNPEQYATDFFPVACYRYALNLFGNLYEPTLIEVSLLALKLGVRGENRKRALTDLTNVFSKIKYESLDSAFGRLCKDKHYYEFYNRPNYTFELADIHRKYSQKIKSLSDRLKGSFDWVVIH